MNSDKERKDKVGAGRPTPTSAYRARLPLLELVLYLTLAGVTMMFAALVTLYLYTRTHEGDVGSPHPFPRWFSLSTVVLLISSYVLAQAPRLYRTDEVPALARCLGATLLLGCIFAGLQVLGWRELQDQGVFFTREPSGTYVYLISALHVLHLLGGMIFLGVLLGHALRASRDGIRTLVFIRNPYWRVRLRLLGIFWHFVDALWVVLFTIFLFLF
ncbi:cytochrome c oxidase subunit 3 [Hymenobacter jeollabukensis]|uniref:Cytochrome c oxidase subunit III n=1 Tax=Hymenobacter jeollabukensis TaxID=2025313 RepID=A0A5R8WWM2_9BACT|nr:cytochrome c oxidase subunit III [Hymenobacter jeollabukensis]TLM96554.1 cytochrome c oxidase subunit III [Hymenobacter jeollabukensis]